MLEIPNICYIFGKLGVQGCQIWHSHVSIPFNSAQSHSTRPHNAKKLFTSSFQAKFLKIIDIYSFCSIELTKTRNTRRSLTAVTKRGEIVYSSGEQSRLPVPFCWEEGWTSLGKLFDGQIICTMAFSDSFNFSLDAKWHVSNLHVSLVQQHWPSVQSAILTKVCTIIWDVSLSSSS